MACSTVAAQTCTSACCVFQTASWQNNSWYTKVPWVYFKFPDFSRINKFPEISWLSRAV